ncbi:chromosome segregation protein SMC [bacterium]|nr:chromosome segregation protein SMC [bacterium]
MHIKELEIDNFKSFANKIEIPFLPGFTTISGPNGSGKSNIIDSVLFALGLSTSRSLRAEKLFHLISTHTKKNEAYVRVAFAPEEGSDDTIEVARRIRKSSQGFNSIYYLNGKISTLSDIHTVLEKYNITPNSYNVMMQGDVMAITNCSAGERRKIIDEIAGVADFDRRIEQAQNELSTVESRVERSTIILNEIDGRLEQLAAEREQALKYQKLNDEKKSYESQLSSAKYFDIKKAIEIAHESILDFNKKKKEEEFKLKELEGKLGETKVKYNEISEEVKAKGEAEQIEIKKRAEELKGQINNKSSAINFADKQIHDNLRTVENAKNGIEVTTQKNTKARENIDIKKAEIEEIEKQISLKKEELSNIIKEQTGLNQTADQHIQKRNELRKELDEIQSQENALIREQAPMEAEVSALRKELDTAKAALSDLHDSKNNFTGNKDKLELQVQELEKELNDLKAVQQNTLQELDTTKNEISDLSYNINTSYRKISALEAQKIAFDEMNLGRPVDTVMNAKVDGVHAPLVQLGQVDEEYSLALEIAMGSRMRSIVVDDEDVAKICVEILKSSKAGRATFLPLSKIKPAPNSLKLPKERGVIDYAINLIDFDDDYTDAFWHALGDTLVVEDFESARRLIGKYRVVTLQGEIFEKSGSITGGSAAKTGLKFSQSQNNELDTFKARLNEMEKKLNSLENKKSELERKLDTVRTNYSNSMTEFNRAKMDLANLIRSQEDIAKNIEDRNRQIAEIEPKIVDYDKKLEKLEEKMLIINEKSLSIQEEISKIESLMPEEELQKLKELTESKENEIKSLENQIAHANNDINDFNREINFNDDVIKAKHEQIEKLLKDNETLNSDKDRYAQDIKDIDIKVQELEEQIRILGEKLIELQAKRDEVHNELLELEKLKNLYENNLERLAEQVESFKARRRELEPQLLEITDELKAANVDVNKLEPLEISVDEINSKVARLQRKIDELGLVNMRALTAYDEVLTRQQELKTKIDTLSQERIQILERMNGFEQLKKETFLKAYNAINENFKDIFNKLSDGEGTLVLENEDSPFSGGMTIEAQPRDKKKQRLEAMSGGEKSLTALAFVFAIQRYMPAPFYALDEVDANLDGINVEKLAHIVQKQSENTQFIVVSHRKPMIESANRTIGVTQKEKGITRVTGVKLRD